MDLWMLLTMVSVGIGFLLFGGSFAAFMYGRPRSLVWGLAIGALVLCTIIPVTLGVFLGTSAG